MASRSRRSFAVSSRPSRRRTSVSMCPQPSYGNMVDREPPKPPDDELSHQLREAIRRKRPWTWQGAVILLLLLAVPVGLILWMVFPRSEPPALAVVAFDELATSLEEVHVRAAVEPRDSN